MCGRYAVSASPEDLALEFELDEDRSQEPTRSVLANPQTPPPGTPDFNLAPTKQAPVILTRRPRGVDGEESSAGSAPQRQLRLLTWGLVPSWAKDTGVGARMINARSESVLEKASFARAAASRRCLVPARGWYEWQVSPTAVDGKGKPRRQPFFMYRQDGASVALAGLYEFWRDRGVPDSSDPQAWLTTFTIITTAAEAGLDRIHDRQPLVLEREDHATWLDPEGTDPTDVARLLAFSSPGRFAAHPVSRAVSSSRNNGVGLLDPVPREELVGVVDPETGEVIN